MNDEEFPMKMRRTIFGFFRKEFIQALRDPRMRFMLIVTPMVQMAVFGLALTSDVKNIKLLAHAQMKDPLLFDIRRDALGGGWFIKGDEAIEGERDAFEEIRSGRSEVALLAPEGGVARSVGDREGRVQALIDSVDLVRSRSVDTDVHAVVREAVEAHADPPSPERLSFSIRTLYNPEMVSAFYLVPGVMCMLICIITIMLTSMSIAKEKEIGTFETLISAPVGAMEILLGKTIPFLAIGAINIPLIMAVAIVGFDVPMRGSFLAFAVASLFFLVTTVSIGTLISTISRNQQQAMMGGFIFLMPAILLSGIMFPVENMPLVFRAVAAVDPLMYYLTLLRNIMLKGGDPGVILSHTAALAAISCASAALAVKRFKLHLG